MLQVTLQNKMEIIYICKFFLNKCVCITKHSYMLHCDYWMRKTDMDGCYLLVVKSKMQG